MDCWREDSGDDGRILVPRDLCRSVSLIRRQARYSQMPQRKDKCGGSASADIRCWSRQVVKAPHCGICIPYKAGGSSGAKRHSRGYLSKHPNIERCIGLTLCGSIDSIIHGLETREITEFHARFDFRKLYSLLNVYRCYSDRVHFPLYWRTKGY